MKQKIEILERKLAEYDSLNVLDWLREREGFQLQVRMLQEEKADIKRWLKTEEEHTNSYIKLLHKAEQKIADLEKINKIWHDANCRMVDDFDKQNKRIDKMKELLAKIAQGKCYCESPSYISCYPCKAKKILGR